jgi:hypothetical protein
MILYLAFMLASGIYVYTRIMHGMDGLRLELKIYSYIVLVIEIMGIVNMLFYGCWLFAKPNNHDITPDVRLSNARSLPNGCIRVPWPRR